jgi:hypothetical protein
MNVPKRGLRTVVTIIQCRRAVLPHIFIRYALPAMRRVFPGQIDVVLVQHRVDASGDNTRLESLRSGTAGLERVRRYTENGMYEGAEILAHEIVHRPYPSIPSYHLAVEAALSRQADFHVWLEDDALIYDLACGRWDELLGPREVGVYNRFHALNTAYLVTRRRFAERIVGKLSRYDEWHQGTRLEVYLRQSMRTSRVYLERSAATRYHHHEYLHASLRYVAEAVRQIAPDAVHLLDEDFGAGASELSPHTAEERAAHARKDVARGMNRLRAAKAALIHLAYRALGR